MLGRISDFPLTFAVMRLTLVDKIDDEPLPENIRRPLDDEVQTKNGVPRFQSTLTPVSSARTQ